MPNVVLVGRSSSHFTRIARIFALELGVAHELQPVYDIGALQSETFGDNPVLRVPSLRTEAGTWFGSMGVCRELARRATSGQRVVWPEELTDVLSSNAQEIITETMAAEVTIVMGRTTELPSDHPFMSKPRARVEASVQWLERELPKVLAAVPEGALSFLEVSAFCLATHLVFREVRDLDDCPNLSALAQRFGRRPSAQQTEYRLDQRP